MKRCHIIDMDSATAECDGAPKAAEAPGIVVPRWIVSSLTAGRLFASERAVCLEAADLYEDCARGQRSPLSVAAFSRELRRALSGGGLRSVRFWAQGRENIGYELPPREAVLKIFCGILKWPRFWFENENEIEEELDAEGLAMRISITAPSGVAIHSDDPDARPHTLAIWEELDARPCALGVWEELGDGDCGHL